MKNMLLTMIFLSVVLALGAQEQRGFVKPSQKGQALSGVTVHVKGGFADWSETGSSSLFVKNKEKVQSYCGVEGWYNHETSF